MANSISDITILLGGGGGGGLNGGLQIGGITSIPNHNPNPSPNPFPNPISARRLICCVSNNLAKHWYVNNIPSQL